MPNNKKLFYFEGTYTPEGKIDKGFVQAVVGETFLNIARRRVVMLYRGDVSHGEIDGYGEIYLMFPQGNDAPMYWKGQIVAGELGTCVASNINDLESLILAELIRDQSQNLKFKLNLFDQGLIPKISGLFAEPTLYARGMFYQQALAANVPLASLAQANDDVHQPQQSPDKQSEFEHRITGPQRKRSRVV